MPNSFVFDANRCTGCGACRLACSIENDLGLVRSWRRIETFNPRHHPSAPLFHLTLACNHCSEPACMYACPALAYRRDEVTGAVLLDENKCIGCKYCSWACPYDAPVFDDDRGVMSKCTFCNHRLQQGLEPACASLCPTGALDFGDLPEADLVNEIDGFPSTGLKPRIRIGPLRPERRLPVMTAPYAREPFVTPIQSETRGLTLKTEWSLMLFTALAAVLVALVASAFAGSASVHPILFAGAAAITMGLAAMHLGRPERAYRAALNPRKSWLSREVLSLTAFMAAAILYLWLKPGSFGLALAATLLGFLSLYCADQVYSVLERAGPGYRHSASVLWTGFYLTGVFLGSGWLAGGFGFGKMSLYVIRKARFIEAGRPVRPGLSAARLSLGFVLPFALWLLEPVGWHGVIIAAVLAGELIDRGEYYMESESTSPSLEMREALEERIAGGAARSERPAAAAAD